jgi:NAD(P)-dependent dehydrogenase (short-subunit alcohol dehydrogenase family)
MVWMRVIFVGRFAEGGYAITIFDTNGPGATRIATALGDLTSVIATQGSVTDEEDVRPAVETTVAKLGTIDVLINNAGIEVAGTVASLTSAEWDQQMAVNLRGVFLMSKYSIPKMRQSGGAIVNISSVHAFVS